MYLVAIARGHVFNDAEQRTAAAAARYFSLRINGIDTPDFMRLSEPTVLAAQGLMTVDDIAAVLRTL